MAELASTPCLSSKTIVNDKGDVKKVESPTAGAADMAAWCRDGCTGTPTMKVRKYILERVTKSIGGYIVDFPPILGGHAGRINRHAGHISLPTLHIIKSLQSAGWKGIVLLLDTWEPGKTKVERRAAARAQAEAFFVKCKNSGAVGVLNFAVRSIYVGNNIC